MEIGLVVNPERLACDKVRSLIDTTLSVALCPGFWRDYVDYPEVKLKIMLIRGLRQ